MIRILRPLLLCNILLQAGLVHAYKEPTHAAITKAAANASLVAQDPAVLRNLGLWSFNRQQVRGANGALTSIEAIMMYGAVAEDGGLRPLNHFYNPINGSKLALPVPNYTSPDWSIEDKEDISSLPGLGFNQEFSYKDAREYLYQALTEVGSEQRSKKLGATFQALGQVMHHVQDMAQPQHVRADAHLDDYAYKIPFTDFALNPLYNPSLYESYTNLDTVRAGLPFSGYAPVYPNPVLTSFATPRQFLTGELRGMSEFTNLNFLSAATNFDQPELFYYPRYDFNKRTVMDISALCAGRVPACPNPGLTGKITFYGSDVIDRNTNATLYNPYASSESIFAPDLEKAGEKSAFALNRFTMELAHTFLIPRAVGYSAGLVNYFFRGKLEISLPEEGVYGAIDHTQAYANEKNVGGFRTIKMQVRNVTPRGSDVEEVDTTGTLRAVAKFRLNTCYASDLSGKDWDESCRSEEMHVVSDPVAAPPGMNNKPGTPAAQVSFHFPNRVPVNATDLYLQVIYRGKLGSETDGIAVATKDISEPHFAVNYDNRDQATFTAYHPLMYFDGPISYDEWCAGGPTPAYPSAQACREGQGHTVLLQYGATDAHLPGFDPASTTSPPATSLAQPEPALNPVVITPAPVGAMTRVAVLTDAVPANRVTWLNRRIDPTLGITNYKWNSGVPVTTVYQKDDETGVLTRSRVYRPSRGVWVSSEMIPDLLTGSAGQVVDGVRLSPVLTLLPSQILRGFGE